jgi:hypothetical protein
MVTNTDIQHCSTGSALAVLDSMEPGLVMAAMLSSIDRSRLSNEDTVRLLVARDRLVSHLQAERAADIAEVSNRSGDEDEFASLEVGAALRLTRTATARPQAAGRPL